jgi:GNAT superfamily N-acetyltransferase
VLTLTDTPDPGFETILEAGLAEYNESHAHRRDWQALAVIVQDPDTAAPVGGILGRTSLGLFFLDLFYLPARLRGGGLGSAAMRMAEAEAIRRGCTAATLVTVNFQAPAFYARHGWETFGSIQSAPDVTRIFMRKTLASP